jgi:DNA-binding transcriptional LysR family regulator
MIVMTKLAFDLEVLRSFATGVELGSFAKAADRLGRSTSAISAQIKKLEEQAGTMIFRKAGRGLALTEAGETLLSYARRLLDLNDEAVIAIQGMTAEGWLRVGLPQDFGETLLPRVLGRFARAHPKVRIEARVARNIELLDLVARGRLDFALAWDDGTAPNQAPHNTPIVTLPARWIGPQDNALIPLDSADAPLPLVAYDDSCWFRSAGTAALDRAGKPWQVVLTSPSLAGIWAGVSAGLGLTIRTPIGLAPGLRVLNEHEYGLPELRSITLAIIRKDAELDPVPERLAAIVVEEVQSLLN